MFYRQHTILAVSFCAAATVLAACAKAPPPPPPALPPLTIVAPSEAKVEASMELIASANVNPNSEGRPSPIVVRIYQLRAEGSFQGADFVPLYADDQKVLGQELISRDEYVLLPGERRTINVRLSNETRFVGAMAAFQKIADAQWRASLVAPSKGVSVVIEEGRIVLSATD
jgi:type VI secretion system protein VasD